MKFKNIIIIDLLFLNNDQGCLVYLHDRLTRWLLKRMLKSQIFSEQIMFVDKYLSIIAHQMEAIVN